MLSLDWCGLKWRLQMPWGNVHDTDNWAYYSPSQVAVTNQEILVLGAEKKPIEGSDIAVGCISSMEPVGYGEFSVEAMLPDGANMWPAFWLFGSKNHPPEIDIFEGYSGDESDYFKFRFLRPWAFWNVQTNIHYKKRGEHKMLGGKTHWLGFKNPSNTWNKYSLKWFPDLIEISYNGKVVRRVTDKDILRQHGEKMWIVLNNMVTKRYNRNTIYFDNFYVRNFEYKPCS